MKLRTLIVFLLFNTQAFTQNPDLIFHSGFEPGSTDTTNGISSDIFGKDNSVPPPNDWIYDLEFHPNIGSFSIQYQGGDDTMRFAKIVQDPTDPSNKVLQFWLKYPNVGGYKGRVQANLYQNINLTEVYQSTRLYLPGPDWSIIKKANGIVDWLTVMEFWNNMYFIDTLYPFRITLGIHKRVDTSSKLTFSLEAQRMEPPPPWPIIWAEDDTSFSIPVDQWMTIETYFKEGDAGNGRFKMTVTPDGGVKKVVFDVTNFTHHPDDPNPDGFASFNPMKLYTSSNVIDYVRQNGGVLQVYWDDFELWKDTSIVLNIPQHDVDYSFKLFPNPMDDYTILEFNNPTNENYTFTLFDMQGKVVNRIAGIESGQVEIKRGNLMKGLYLFKLSTSQGKGITGKLILE